MWPYVSVVSTGVLCPRFRCTSAMEMRPRAPGPGPCHPSATLVRYPLAEPSCSVSRPPGRRRCGRFVSERPILPGTMPTLGADTPGRPGRRLMSTALGVYDCAMRGSVCVVGFAVAVSLGREANGQELERLRQTQDQANRLEEERQAQEQQQRYRESLQREAAEAAERSRHNERMDIERQRLELERQRATPTPIPRYFPAYVPEPTEPLPPRRQWVIVSNDSDAEAFGYDALSLRRAGNARLFWMQMGKGGRSQVLADCRGRTFAFTDDDSPPRKAGRGSIMEALITAVCRGR